MRLLELSDVDKSKRLSRGLFVPAKDKYQLQLRIDDEFHKYMEILVCRAGVETTSELIRLALRELDRARAHYDGIKLPNDIVVGIPETNPVDNEDRVIPFRKNTATRRVNVVLRGVAYQRLRRLIEWSGGRPLVDLVAIALGVLDATLTTEEEELRASSSANRPAQFEVEYQEGHVNAR